MREREKFASLIRNVISQIWVLSRSPPGPMSIRGPRKGENYELSVDLNSEYRDKRKDAIKRVIASMTVGKGRYPSVSSLP